MVYYYFKGMEEKFQINWKIKPPNNCNYKIINTSNLFYGENKAVKLPKKKLKNFQETKGEHFL